MVLRVIPYSNGACLFIPQHSVAKGKPRGIPLTGTSELTKNQITFTLK